MYRLKTVLAAGAILAASAAPARAATLTVVPLPTASSKPTQLISGPDGLLWFTQTGTQHQVGRFNPSTGQFAPITLPAIDEATTDEGTTRLARSVNGYVWVLDNGGQELYRVAPAGTVAHALPYGGTSTYDDALSMADELVPAAGGGVWTLFDHHNPALPGNDYNGATIVDDSGHPTLVTNQLYENPHPGVLDPRDGSIWIADYNYVTHIGTGGAITRFPTGLNALYTVSSVLLGPDGTLWFTAYESGSWFTSPSDGLIGHLVGGQVQTIKLNSRSVPDSLRLGPDGALWWGERLSNVAGQPQGAIGRLDPATGAFQEGSVGNYKPAGVAFADNGSLWFIDTDANLIANVAIDGALFPPAAPPAGPAPVAPAPVLPAAPKPTLRTASAKLKTVAAKRRFDVRCTLAAAGTCTVTATLPASTAKKLKLGKKTYTLATAHKTLKKKGTVTLVLKLSKSEATKLRRYRHTVKVTVTATSSAAGHAPVSTKKTLSLKP